MPYKYIGRTTNQEGKTLWEILGNLKNFGVGRIVVRNINARYPEPSYIKILKVETLANPETVTLDNFRKVRVWVEKVFRGKPFPKPITLESATYKPDYRLIPKDQEEKYCKYVAKENSKILPKYFQFPPLLKEIVKRDIKAEGGVVPEEPQLEIMYNKNSKYISYRIAEEDEEPNVEVVMGFGTPKSKSLYEGIKL